MKTTLDIYDITGKVTSKIDVPAAFDVKIDPKLLALAVRVYLANQRQATSKVKTRGEVNKTTKKVWKQKGTGRARHGSKGAPIFVGGGVAHGPSGDQEYGLKLPKKMRQLAIVAAFAQSIKDNKVVVVDGLDKVKPNTKAIADLINKLKLVDSKSVCLLEQPLKDLIQGAKNIKQFTISQAKRTNVYELMSADKIILHKPALDVLAATFAHVEPKSEVAKPKSKPAVKAN